MSKTRYIPAKEVAVMIRKDLKEKFPGTTFSVVTKHSSSINVDWTDGPTAKQVDELIGWYAGADFDPMIDLKSHHDSTLNGEKVSFGADYIFTRRSLSRKACEQVASIINNKYGFKVKLTGSDSWGWRLETLEWNPSNEHWKSEELRNWTAQPEQKQQKQEQSILIGNTIIL